MVAQSIVPLNQDTALNAVAVLKAIVYRLREEQMIDGQDYGKIPGTNDKPTLLLPGMEKLMRALNVVPSYVEKCVIRDYDKALFHYEYECKLVDAETGVAVSGGVAVGLAHSYESKWRYRWVTENRVPPNVDKSTLEQRNATLREPAFAISKKETTGKFGKPAEYWKRFEDAIENGTANPVKMPKKDGGTMDAWEIGGIEYRILNVDIFDQINTICKIAQKRALSSAIKGAAAVSEFFTVDLEDYSDQVITVTPEVIEEKPAPEPPKATNITPINSFPSKSPRLPVQSPPEIIVTDGTSALQPAPEIQQPEETPSLNGKEPSPAGGDVPKDPQPSENKKATKDDKDDISKWQHWTPLMAHESIKALYPDGSHRGNVIKLLKKAGAFESGKVSSMVWRIQMYHQLRAKGHKEDEAASAAATAPDELEGF